MARPGRPERNRAARSFRQLRRFHHVINSDKVFGTHNGDCCVFCSYGTVPCPPVQDSAAYCGQS
ncbi:GDCCVxC domain-containing (seleno)protein [Nitrobacter sp. JJSN]|uniref:GDCCVxC domain-containing (seleno)protein n=1 Tax=Nitrobacter sp. JJSN TaxID=3453033 RepID=UPI003F76B239